MDGDLVDAIEDAQARADEMDWEAWYAAWRLENARRLRAMARTEERTWCDHCESFFYGSGHPCTTDDAA